MKTLKLEVGKTYRNRKGEEVKIVDKINPYGYHYQGSNGKWYTESGRFDVRVAKSSSDLIEELPETRHAFDIPEGVKQVTVEQVGNRIVVEMMPEDVEPKPGDVPESTRIREWMDMNIKCGGEVVDIAEVIERYLKYREGEK